MGSAAPKSSWSGILSAAEDKRILSRKDAEAQRDWWGKPILEEVRTIFSIIFIVLLWSTTDIDFMIFY
jgi:hypothetical protein